MKPRNEIKNVISDEEFWTFMKKATLLYNIKDWEKYRRAIAATDTEHTDTPNKEELVNLLRAGNITRFNELRSKSSVPINLSGANLFGADLSKANLSKANLSKANLFGANLSKASLHGADLSGADLSGANLSKANLFGADLSGANLSGANLSGANLFGADLSGADLSGAVLSISEEEARERGAIVD